MGNFPSTRSIINRYITSDILSMNGIVVDPTKIKSILE